MIFQSIPLEQILLEDRTFFLPHSFPEKVRIKKGSQPFNPVWLKVGLTGNYQIVDGFVATSQLAEQNPQGKIDAFVFPERENSFSLLKRRIEKRKYEENFSLLGLGECILRFQESCSIPQESLASFLKQFGLVPMPRVLSLMERILSLKEVLFLFTDPYQLSLKELTLLNKKKEEDLRLIGEMLKGLQLTGNKLLTLIELIDDLRKGFDLPLAELRKLEVFSSSHFDMPDNARYKEIKNALTQHRFPRLSKMKDDWKKAVKEIGFSSNLELVEDLSFESDRIRILIQAGSQEELQEQIGELAQKREQDKLAPLFKFV